MTEKIRADLIEIPGYFSMAIPKSWEWDIEDDVMTALPEDATADDFTMIQISLSQLKEPARPGDRTAEALLHRYMKFLGWEFDEDDWGVVEMVDGEGARVTHLQHPDEPFPPNPPPGKPVLWQFWFAVKGDRYALITQRIESVDNAERYWVLGQSIIEQSFRWDPGEA